MKTALTIATLIALNSFAPAATYILNADGTVSKQELTCDAKPLTPDPSPLPAKGREAAPACDRKNCDCGCQSGQTCLCTTQGGADALPFVQATADVIEYRQVCGPTGCQLVPVSVPTVASAPAPAIAYTETTFASDFGTTTGGFVAMTPRFPRLARVRGRLTGRAPTFTVAVPAPYAAQGYQWMPQGTLALPVAPALAPAPLTAAQKAVALQRGQWMQLVFKYGFAVVQLMPELIPLVQQHGWQVLTNPAVDAWIVQAIFAINHGQPIPPVPVI